MHKGIYISMFVVSILIASFSQILLKKGASKKNIYINKYTVIGYSLMVLSMVFTLIGYKGVDLTMSGILQGLSFVFVPLLGIYFLKEKINRETVIGIIFIILGIIIYSL